MNNKFKMAAKARDHVRVLYDYDYVNQDGRRVSIRVDEEYVLLKKTSQEWWYVVKKGVTKIQGEAFYVPASYVEIIHKTVIDLDADKKPAIAGKPKKPPPRPPKPKTKQPKITDEEEVLKELDDLLESEYQTLGSLNTASLNVQNGNEEETKLSSSGSDTNSNSKSSLDKLSNNDLDTEVKIDANSNIPIQLPDYANLSDIRASAGLQPLVSIFCIVSLFVRHIGWLNSIFFSFVYSHLKYFILESLLLSMTKTWDVRETRLCQTYINDLPVDKKRNGLTLQLYLLVLIPLTNH